MSYQAHSFVDSLKVETVAEKAVLHAMAHRHSHRTAILEISESEIARGSAVSKRHVIDVLKALEARQVIRRTRKGKSSGWASRFEFVNFHFRPLGSQGTGEPGSPVSRPVTGEPGSSVLVNSSPATGELALPAYKEESKTKFETENQIPPNPLFQRGASPAPQPVVRRKLSSRDVRDLVKAIDSIYAAGAGTAIQFSEAFERACAKRLIHPDDARRAIGLTTDLAFESRKPPERAAG